MRKNTVFSIFHRNVCYLKILVLQKQHFLLFTENCWPKLPCPAGSDASGSGKYLSESEIVMLYVDKLQKLHIEEADNPHFGKSKIIGMRQNNRFKLKKATIQSNLLSFIFMDLHEEYESLIAQGAILLMYKGLTNIKIINIASNIFHCIAKQIYV